MTVRVLIAGGGLGGLTLAHGLRSAGLDVHVFERAQPQPDPDTSYRIHLDAAGSRALHACLPPEVWDVLDARSGIAPLGIGFVNEHLQCLTFIAEDAADPIRHSRPISRIGLRQILLTGLQDVVHFDKRLVSYDSTSAGVVAHFADGSSAQGDVLVGADGSASAVRKQLLPSARIKDTGVTGIAGKLYLTDRVPEHLMRQMTMVLPAGGLGMFMAALRHKPGLPGVDPAIDLPDHLFWVIIGRAEPLGITAEARASQATLHALAREKASAWHPVLSWIVSESDPHSLISVPLHTAERVHPWKPRNVTLLGDAIHTMPPLQGLGGNTALRDAALLREHLVRVDRGQADLPTALGAYQAAMLDYGFEAVRRSVQVADAVATTNPLARFGFSTVLRAAERIPPLHQRMFARAG